MKRIVIYAYNEEIAGLRPLAEKLEKQGAAARFMNLKYNEPAKCDIALAEEKYVPRVKEIFTAFPDVEVKALDADLSKTIKDHNKGPAPRQGDSTRTAEAVEPTVKTLELKVEDTPPTPEVLLHVGGAVTPGPDVDVTTIAPRKPSKKGA